MEINLLWVKRLEEDDNKKSFKPLVENTYKEVVLKEKREEGSKWSGKFMIDYNDELFEYFIDSEESYLTYLSLDGYLQGEPVIIDDDVEAHLVKKGSGILEAFVFNEVRKLNILSKEKLDAIEYTLFPKFSNGFIDNSQNKINKDIVSFMEIFYPILKENEVIVEYEIEPLYQKDDSEDLKAFKKELSTKYYFIYYDRGYGEYLPKKAVNELVYGGSKFTPDKTLSEIFG